MAFNFNWSPLTADADFYRRARDLLTKALNKSPKPPIIVDDILVSEFNLGTVPPDLEILEIGDLAEDRFRGIFKMCYSGDAFLTLKTRVQSAMPGFHASPSRCSLSPPPRNLITARGKTNPLHLPLFMRRGCFAFSPYKGGARPFLSALNERAGANPLNTYLYSKPSFTSPQPLAAASGLTIPLSITLSEIKLSAFIILVFSKQKGLTLVFRNDPLESLKVSSTFDSIQFVRDYLQRTIEQQLRNLMMDELPAIIHRLSLELWCPDQANKGTQTPQEDVDEKGVDPFASPPLDPVDANGNLLDPNAISELSLNGGGEMQYLFSQKNLLRLAALTDSHRTLSLFTPGIRDVVFRAWSGYGDRSESATPALATPSLTKTYSFPAGGSTTYTFSDSGSTAHGYFPSRPSLVSVNSTSALPHGSGHRSRPGRKKKTRVVNLRRSRSEAGSTDGLSEADSSETASVNVPSSEPVFSTSIPEEPETQSAEAAATASGKVRFTHMHKDTTDMRQAVMSEMLKRNLEQAASAPKQQPGSAPSAPLEIPPLSEKAPASHRKEAVAVKEHGSSSSDTSSVILEQAWIMKMAGEIARRVYDEKNRQRQGMWDDTENPPPPAYEAATP
ncbi:mitochondrial distribution and morphology protein 34 [Purpureocillium lilacinum]|uniref:Mitochondrial distribution and morphology protein 34 n=1 Tax=Purpureocillium lilacinum TaxID=33203 RepID=A0A2U3EJR2_PURLI|nr:mitochondrial distribution and morphology protein 34 [Purpureocillium lilacinum]